MAIGCAATMAARPAVAEGWPAIAPAEFSRGAGGGLAIIPVACWWLLTLGWVFTTDWLSRDSVRRGFAPAVWGPVAALSFPILALIAWWIPWTWAALVLTSLAWLVPVLSYTFARNPKVHAAERVLTVGHMKRLMAPLFARFGVEIETLDDAGGDLLPTVLIRTTAGGDPHSDPSVMERLTTAAAAFSKALADSTRIIEGYTAACGVMQGAAAARAGRIRLDVAPGEVNLHYFMDGIWVKPRVMTARGSKKVPEQWADAPALARPAADAVIVILKAMAGIDARGKGPQRGSFVIDVDGKPRPCTLIVQTVPTGEQLVVEIESKPAPMKGCADIGMPPALIDRLSELLGLEKGVLLLSSPPASGLSTTFDIVVGMTDRLMRDFISIEDAAAPAAEIQNVKPIRYDTKAEQTSLSVLAKALLDYPAAVITRDLREPPLGVELVRLADEEKFVVISLKGSDAIDAISRLVGCKVPVDQVGRSLLGSLSQRLVRKLCPKCRTGIPPSPKQLALLKKKPEQLQQIFQASPNGCRLCHGQGYLGRTAVFELASGPTVRKAVAAKADPQTIRKAAIQDGMVTLQEAALALVSEGVTSFEEVQRVFAAPAAKKQVTGGAQS